VITVIWIPVIAAMAILVIGLIAFTFLIAGIHSTERRMSLRNAADTSPSRSFARRMLRVHYQPMPARIREKARR
jgi:hypothetical protein